MTLLLRLDPRRRLVVLAASLAELLVVVLVAATQPTDGALAVAVALVLAPVAVIAVAGVAAQLAGGRFPGAAAVVYVVLPLLGNRYVLGPYRGEFDANAVPALVGTQSTVAFAIGVAAAVGAALVPRRIVAAAGAAAFVAALVAWGAGGVGGLQPLLHETAYSVALGEWLVVATVAAAVLRRPLVGVGIAGFVLAVLLRASARSFDHAGFWHELGAAAPLAAVLLSSLGLLVPRLRPAPSAAR